MPGNDRTGPLGRGPMTGRGMGPCGRGLARGAGTAPGRGFGRGMGRGMGPYWGSAPAYQPTKEQELADLRAEKVLIEQDLEAIRARLKELETKK